MQYVKKGLQSDLAVEEYIGVNGMPALRIFWLDYGVTWRPLAKLQDAARPAPLIGLVSCTWEGLGAVLTSGVGGLMYRRCGAWRCVGGDMVGCPWHRARSRGT